MLSVEVTDNAPYVNGEEGCKDGGLVEVNRNYANLKCKVSQHESGIVYFYRLFCQSRDEYLLYLATTFCCTLSSFFYYRKKSALDKLRVKIRLHIK